VRHASEPLPIASIPQLDQILITWRSMPSGDAEGGTSVLGEPARGLTGALSREPLRA
jgi:hypothetical protein